MDTMQDTSRADHGFNQQVFLLLGEMRGQLAGIQSLLINSNERMDRQDSRMDSLERRIERTLEDTKETEQRILEGIAASIEKTEKATSSLDKRTGQVEKRLLIWSTVGATLLFITEFGMKLVSFLGGLVG